MRVHALGFALACVLMVRTAVGTAAQPSVGVTDGGVPDFRAVERLLNDATSDGRRRLTESIGAMERYVRSADATTSQLVILGRAYLRVMGIGGTFRAGQLANQALKRNAKDGPAHLLLAELAGYSACTPCAEEAIRAARESGVDEASIAAMEGLALWFQAAADNNDRRVGEAPPVERAVKAYERAIALEKDEGRLASYRAALFDLERSAGNHAKMMEQAEALLASGKASDDFAGRYAAFLLYERGDVEAAAPLAARAAGDSAAIENGDVFAMVLFRIWADGYLSNPADVGNRVKLEAAQGSNRDVGAVFAKSLSSSATLPVATALLKAKLLTPGDPGMRDAMGNAPIANAIASARADHARTGGNDAYRAPLNDEQFELVERLLKAGANPNAYIFGWNQTLLGHAAARADVRTTKLLLSHGANVHGRMADGSTVLFEAARAREHAKGAEIAAMFIERKVAVTSVDKRGETALHAAARNGNVMLISQLLGAGADPMAKDNSGWRPLELATSAGHVEAVKALLAAGAKVNAAVSACGSTNALEIAERMRHQELIELLRSRFERGT